VEFTSLDFPAELYFVKSLSFMNETGPALLGFMKKKSIRPDEILVVVDEFMIPFGELRLGQKGSAGGHNGMKSIIQSLGTQEFKRLRVGIGPVPEGQDAADFVLKKFSKSEQEQLPKIFEAIEQTIQTLLEKGFEKAATGANKNHL
jgi:PTH1 family peptidyl-tRNA hydrolase